MVKVPVRVPTAVGVKVTLIRHFAPATSVAPQGFVLVVCAKSPLVVMLLMSSVEAPVLVRVTVFAPLVTPTTTLLQASDVGDTVTVGPVTVEVTVRLIGVEEVKLPDMPETVTVVVPGVAVGLAVSVNTLVEVVGFVPNPAVTPLGIPEALNVTLPVKPPLGTTVIVLVRLVPCTMLNDAGFAVSVKPGPAGPVRSLIRPDPLGLPQPVAKSYPTSAGKPLLPLVMSWKSVS